MKKGKPKFRMTFWTAVAVLLYFSCNYLTKKERTDNARLEIPQITVEANEQIINHVGYSVSFNDETKIPNWVAYELTASESDGEILRDGMRFCPDPEIGGFQADNDDYRNSGWDKGHLAPAADMKWSEQAMRESFYFSNICPQNHNLNAGVWKTLEDKSRDYAVKYGSVYIVCGPLITSNEHGHIGDNRVVVPDGFYKVLLVRHDGVYDGIGFYFKNAAGRKKLKAYAFPIDKIEEMTGMDFFHALPDDIENEVESRYNAEVWGL